MPNRRIPLGRKTWQSFFQSLPLLLTPLPTLVDMISKSRLDSADNHNMAVDTSALLNDWEQLRRDMQRSLQHFHP